MQEYASILSAIYASSERERATLITLGALQGNPYTSPRSILAHILEKGCVSLGKGAWGTMIPLSCAALYILAKSNRSNTYSSILSAVAVSSESLVYETVCTQRTAVRPERRSALYFLGVTILSSNIASFESGACVPIYAECYPARPLRRTVLYF